MREQNEKPAGYGNILFEMKQLISIAQLGVEYSRRHNAECSKHQRSRTGVVSEQDRQATTRFECDGERQEFARHPKSFHVSNSSGITGELAPGFMQENTRKQRAPNQGRSLEAMLQYLPQFVFGVASEIAFSRSASSSQPPGHSFFKAATFSLAFSTCPVST